MKILVAVKQVLNLDDEFEMRADGLDVDRDYCDRDLNEWDDYALEEALRLKELAGGAVEVIAATIGPEEANEEIRTCLAKGADRGVRVWDEALEGAGGMVVARLLAALAQRESAGLVLAGVQGADHGHAQTGVAVAAMLGWPCAAVVRALDWKPGGPQARVRRELEGGVEEDLSIDCPAVLTIQVGINRPRYASLRGIKLAASKPIEARSPADLGVAAADIDAATVSRVRRMYVPERHRAEMIEGTPAQQAARLAEIVKGLTGGAR